MGQNVVLLVFDAARRDSLEPYGAPAGASPAVGQLAGRGLAAKQVHATGSWTLPSHASMFSGLMPRAAGLSRATSPMAVRGLLREQEERLLPARMRAAGYRTAASSANLWLSETIGFDTGFDEFSRIDGGRNAQINSQQLRKRLSWYGEALRGRVDDGAERVLDEMRRWSAQDDERPFFWFVNLLECHSPYLPPYPYGGRNPWLRLRAAADARRHHTLAGFWRACTGIEQVPESVQRRARALYAASIRLMDDWLSRLLEMLDGSGVLDDTLVIILSDHGENFGEGGLIGHAMSLDERLIHVPLVAAGPGFSELDLVSLAELPAAIARACGLSDEVWVGATPGSIAVAQYDPPIMSGETENLERLRKLGIEGEALERFIAPLTCAVDGRDKVLRQNGTDFVLDLEADPLEESPVRIDSLEGASQDRLASLVSALDFGSERVDATSARGSSQEAENADLEERMRLLGYL